MGLTMSQRQAVTKTIATRYKRASRAEKRAILNELCATTGWHRSHARRALGQALVPKVVRPGRPRAPTYGANVVVALRFCWAVPGAPTGKRLAPVMGELVATLRRFGELDVSDELAGALVIVAQLDVLRDVRDGARPGGVESAVDALVLQGRVERFCPRVVLSLIHI